MSVSRKLKIVEFLKVNFANDLSLGTLIRRHRIPKSEAANGQHYIVSDFNVQKEVTFYNRTFKIVGCDQFTRVS
jgi:hypothetical protein